MDLFMPEMDGYEAARVLKADPTFASVPILAYTARSSPPDIESGLCRLLHQALPSGRADRDAPESAR